MSPATSAAAGSPRSKRSERRAEASDEPRIRPRFVSIYEATD
jgi:hypothetical protein